MPGINPQNCGFARRPRSRARPHRRAACKRHFAQGTTRRPRGTMGRVAPARGPPSPANPARAEAGRSCVCLIGEGRWQGPDHPGPRVHDSLRDPGLLGGRQAVGGLRPSCPSGRAPATDATAWTSGHKAVDGAATAMTQGQSFPASDPGGAREGSCSQRALETRFGLDLGRTAART